MFSSRHRNNTKSGYSARRQRLLRQIKRRTRWFKVQREIEFVRLVGLSQTVRFTAP